MSATARGGAHAIGTDRLIARLESELAAAAGVVRRVAAFDRRPSSYQSSFEIEELDVVLDDGTALALMFKHLGHHAALAGGRPVKPMFLHDPLREALVYRDILSARPLGTARCYGVLIEPDRAEYGVFLERLEGMPLCFVGEFDAWTAAARWLAALHTIDERRTSRLQHVPLLRYDRAFYWQWFERALQNHGGEASLGWLSARYERVVDRLVTLAPTFIHGEFYASNILTEPSADRLRICPVDWEMAAIGPGLIDLAALAAGSWTEAQRRRLAEAYLDAAGDAREPAPIDRVLEDLDYCRLHLAVQWLGWAADWSPPPDHRQNWLAVATEIAERLSLRA